MNGISQDAVSSLMLSGNDDTSSCDDKVDSGVQQHGAKSFLPPIEMDIVISDLECEKRELEMLVAQEEACLEEEMAALREVRSVFSSQTT